jgi:hypothetical protein
MGLHNIVNNFCTEKGPLAKRVVRDGMNFHPYTIIFGFLHVFSFFIKEMFSRTI